MEPIQTPDLLATRLLGELRALADPVNVVGMSRFGIATQGTLGVSVSSVRELAREAHRSLGKDRRAHHELALLLWGSGVHEARIMASLVDDPAYVDEAQMDTWVAEVDSWDICDSLCNNLLRRTAAAWDKAQEWSAANPEFTRRAGFVLVATLAVHDKAAPDDQFSAALGWIECGATDERNMVKKSVNWSLRQIGKRSAPLNALAISTAERILAEKSASAPARWIARDALRELRSSAVRTRLGLG